MCHCVCRKYDYYRGEPVAVEIANLIVTLPSWGVSDHPLADALAKAGPKFWVNVQKSPMKMLQLTNDTW